MVSRLRCCYCHLKMRVPVVGGNRFPFRPTRDHILPRARGGTLDGETSNIRICCQRCNELRGALGHCTGALACFIATIPPRMRWRDVRQAGRAWRASSTLFNRLPA